MKIKITKKNRNTFLALLILFLSIVISCIIGFGNFLVSTDISSGNSGNIVNDPVCYNSNTGIYYTTIEKALEDANTRSDADTIIVLPGTNPTITRNCTISSNDSLIVSYDDGGTRGNRNAADDFYSGNTYHNKTVTFVSTVTISEGISLTNYGLIENYAEIVAASQNQWGGFPTRNCTQFLLEANAKILNYGTINGFGYFNESSSNNGSEIISYSGSIIHLPFSIFFRGGTATVALTGGLSFIVSIVNDLSSSKIFPFDQYEITNVTANTVIYSGCYIYAHFCFNLSDPASGDSRKSFTEQINLVGDKNLSNCLFKLHDNSFMNMKYNGVENGINPIKLDFYGGMDMEEVSITLNLTVAGISASRTLNSSEYYFPFCYNMNISLNALDEDGEATYNFDNLLKFMPGSSLFVNERVTLNLTGTTVVYKDVSSGDVGALYKSGYGDANFVILGEVYANNFAGFVSTDSNDSLLLVSGSSSITTQELVSNNDDANYYTYTNNASAFINNENNLENIKSNYLYEGRGKYWIESSIVLIKQKNIESITIYDNSGRYYENRDYIDANLNVTINIKYADLPNKKLIINGFDYSSSITSTEYSINLTIGNGGLIIEAYAGVYTLSVTTYNASFSIIDEETNSYGSGDDIVYGTNLTFKFSCNETVSRVIINGQTYNYTDTEECAVGTFNIQVTGDINITIISGIRKLSSDVDTGLTGKYKITGTALLNDNEVIMNQSLTIEYTRRLTTKKKLTIYNNGNLEIENTYEPTDVNIFGTGNISINYTIVSVNGDISIKIA